MRILTVWELAAATPQGEPRAVRLWKTPSKQELT